MYHISIGTVIKQERKWLKEWIRYHKSIGVEHFFLYSNDTYKEYQSLQSFLEKEPVTLYFLPDCSRPQLEGLRGLLMLCRSATQWLALIDPDEFIVFPSPKTNLSTFLKDYEEPWIGSLSLHWKVFGSDGFKQSPDLVLPTFTRRAKDNHQLHKIVKQIIRPEFTKEIGGSHYCIYEPNYYPVNELKEVLPYFPSRTTHLNVPIKAWKPGYSTHKHIWLNHYCVKSKYDWKVKQQRGYVNKNKEVNWSAYWKEMDRNEVKDTTMVSR